MPIFDFYPPIGTVRRSCETTTLYNDDTVGLTIESARRVDTTRTMSLFSDQDFEQALALVDLTTPVENIYTLLPGAYLVTFNEKIIVGDNATMTTSLSSSMVKCGCFSVEAGGTYVLHVAGKFNIHVDAPIAYVHFDDTDNFFQRLYKKVVTLC